MRLSIPTCTKDVDVIKSPCPYCKMPAVKNGFTVYKRQRYFCKSCKKSFLLAYTNVGYAHHTSKTIVRLLKEGCGIRSISRLISICTDTVIKRIKHLASRISKPIITFNKSYEMDELRTFVLRKDKPIWIAYAIRQDTGEVADFRIGNRSNKTLSGVLNTLLLSEPKMIHTDKLANYK